MQLTWFGSKLSPKFHIGRVFESKEQYSFQRIHLLMSPVAEHVVKRWPLLDVGHWCVTWKVYFWPQLLPSSCFPPAWIEQLPCILVFYHAVSALDSANPSRSQVETMSQINLSSFKLWVSSILFLVTGYN